MGATTFLGNSAVFSFGGVSLEPDLNSLDINFKKANLDDTTFGDTWESGMPGIRSFTLAAAGFVNKTGGANDAVLFADLSTAATPTAFAIGLAGTTPGNPKYTGVAIQTDLKEGVKVKALAALSVSLTGSGAPQRGTY